MPCLVLTAGTVATGAIDPLEAGPGAAWRHVDAAWAGPLRLSGHTGLLAGIEAADSVAVCAHKWLYQPKESALVLAADPDRAHDALSFGGGYLAAPNVGLLGSHANTALPLATTLLAWGRAGVAGRIDANMAVAERLADLIADLIADAPELELWDGPVTGVVNWRPRRGDPAAVRAQMRDAWISLADIAGDSWFRSVAQTRWPTPRSSSSPYSRHSITTDSLAVTARPSSCRTRSGDQIERAPRSAGTGELAVACDQRAIEAFGQGDIRSVVGGEVVAQLPNAL